MELNDSLLATALTWQIKMLNRRWIIRAAKPLCRVLAPCFAVVCLTGGAQAALRLCNQSFDVLNVAIGTPDGSSFVTQGWWRVAPNQCATLQREVLQSRYFYLFAADVFGNEVLAGAIPMCVAPRRFHIDGQQDCLLRGYLDARFAEIDTQEQDNWTVFVTPRPG